MWKCINCNKIINENEKNSIHISDGRCPFCKKTHVLIRYDERYEEGTSPI